MLDKAIKVLNVREGAHFPLVGNPERVLTYTFTVGKFGPFTEEFSAADQHADAVHRRLNERATLLRMTSDLGPGEE
jgi:hypothetical protein